MGKLQSITRRGLFAASLALLVVGCLSPTLPLPPPSRPDVSSPDGAGYVRVTGMVRGEATAYVANIASGRIVGQMTDETGEYDVSLVAESGDRLAVWYTVGTEKSASTEVIVPPAGGGPGQGGFGGSDQP